MEDTYINCHSILHRKSLTGSLPIGGTCIRRGIKELHRGSKIYFSKGEERSYTVDDQQPFKGDQCISRFVNRIIQVKYAGGELANIYKANPILPCNNFFGRNQFYYYTNCP
jgi:hypothetical protein